MRGIGWRDERDGVPAVGRKGIGYWLEAGEGWGTGCSRERDLVPAGAERGTGYWLEG